MRYGLLIKASLAISLAVSFLNLPAAQYRDGQLFIEVLLCSGNPISITSESGTPASVTFSQPESPVSRNIQTPFTLRLEGGEGPSGWTWLERREPWGGDSQGVLRETFAWQDSALVIVRESLVYSDQICSSRDEAARRAGLKATPEAGFQIMPLHNSTVHLLGAEGSSFYLETPLGFTAADPLYLDGVKLGFSGDFILKTINGKLVLTHFLPLEEYVAGVIANEIGGNAPLEALKAQAVAARTHAVSLLLGNRHTSDGYDLCNTTHCQVYKGKYRQNENVRAAVIATQNEILTINGRIADATYHSCCGGKTDSSQAIWNGAALPHLGGVVCLEAAAAFNLSLEADVRRWIAGAEASKGGSSWEASASAWSKKLGRRELAKNVGLKDIDHLLINRHGVSGRITAITFYGDKTVRLTSEFKIRQAFGSAKSSLFYIEGNYTPAANGGAVIHPGTVISLRGRGSGHGVGMCQVGALRKARAGEDYMKILSHYYPGTLISGNWMSHE